jgi:hypothetical protein
LATERSSLGSILRMRYKVLSQDGQDGQEEAAAERPWVANCNLRELGNGSRLLALPSISASG